MSDDWIYVGADNSKKDWSKVGKTTKGLNKRHTSSQNPEYYIHTAFEIKSGDVHEIEKKLLGYIEGLPDVERQRHFSTGNKSECFFVSPDEMVGIVECFIERFYGSSVYYENSLHGGMSRYQLNDSARKEQTSLGLSSSSYFTGNNEVYETDLGDGYFVDHGTGMEGWRDEDGNVYWKEWK
ncbi:Uncharacterised protein [BD1-7 clade bacterium]|uniref:Uncharacterized protein n=1 Tax=BD1-7 clade bacterium TaxID=2029982 RepID=A0A5S9Q6W2_9GAMM|nr:Uncharacterised protein [BD1-7 clade bacterium]